jgi:DNA-directed RNA polymerase subunit RPC12/RpoP
MPFSTADITLLRIRCPKCGQHNERPVTVLVRRDEVTCSNCGRAISLRTRANKLLIEETAASCGKIGAELMKLEAEPRCSGGAFASSRQDLVPKRLA